MVIDIRLRLSILRPGENYGVGGNPQIESEYELLIDWRDVTPKPTWAEIMAMGEIELDDAKDNKRDEMLEAHAIAITDPFESTTLQGGTVTRIYDASLQGVQNLDLARDSGVSNRIICQRPDGNTVIPFHTAAEANAVINDLLLVRDGYNTNILTKGIAIKNVVADPNKLNGNTISFVAPNIILDSNNGLSIFLTNSFIRIVNASLNDNIYEVDTSTPGELTLVEQTIMTQSEVLTVPTVTLYGANDEHELNLIVWP